jgi:hypothetical protein
MPNTEAEGIRVYGRWLKGFWTFVDDVGVPDSHELMLHQLFYGDPPSHI